MADNQEKSTETGAATNNSFSKGMLKDYNDTFVGDGLYTHARNAVNNSHDGQVGVIGNEPSNILCVTLPYTMIGCIHLTDDQWVIFTTNNTDSEIGIFDESACSYKKVVNSQCLNFKTSHLITGAYRKRFDCERLIYWDDGINPTRTMDIDNVPFIYTVKFKNGCEERTYTDKLDCEAIRMCPLIQHPCIKLKKGTIAGTLPNGSYQACIAYTINQMKVSDYIGLSEVQSLWSYENVNSSLEITIDSIDDDFDEFELVLVTNINQQTVAKSIGYYSTAQGTIYVDRWDPEYITVPISQVVLRSDALEKSDAMYTVNNYLLRVGTYSKYKFNYQPLANKIKANWVAVEYPAKYYVKGGNNTGYMRDEQYAFFIRWIYNTGERTESYHIPGRAPSGNDLNNIADSDAFEVGDGLTRKYWQVQNTASVTSYTPSVLSDGGNVVATGKMGYWESTEKYPSNKPDIWGDLCGKNIRHHKMPDITVDEKLNHYNNDTDSIVILGVQFSNIAHPLDQNGTPIESIVGYEILRGTRQGNKSIIAKGLFNNMREYPIPGNSTSTGLYQNYPYNDLGSDMYLTATEQTGTNGSNSDGAKTAGLSGYRKNIFSFHSPEVSFSNPYLNANEVKLYQEMYGTALGTFEVPYMHPKFKLLSNDFDTALDIIITAITVVQAGEAITGGYKVELSGQGDLPPVKLGVDKVLAEGSLGAVGDTLEAAALVLNGAFNIAYLTFFGTKVTKQQLLAMIYALLPYRQFAAQYNSHGFYNQATQSVEGSRRRKITDAIYVGSSLQQFTTEYQINNYNRSRYVCIKVDGEFDDPTNIDDSRITIGSTGTTYSKSVSTNIASHYGALKISIPSQYGQLDSIKQLSISECIYPSYPILKAVVTSPVFFGGDTYIGRFTEKNSMFFFNTWLYEEPDGTEFDYTLYPNLPYPRFWINSQKYVGLFNDRPSNHRSLDKVRQGNWFYLNEGYFYLFNSGVRDFYVESEINLAYRDYEDDLAHRHYDPYGFTDINSMFRSDTIKNGNYYKYDYSLSISNLFNSNISWGNLLPRDYNPSIAATCYTYRPNRVIYSLPQQDESKKDSWRIFLANNYKDFNTSVTSIKPINKTGAFFMMKFQGPLQFMGVEELKLDGTGAKITIGDGALFSGPQQLQSVVNVDESYEYGSCQSKYSAIGTKYGVFYVSQNQGKVFNYAGEGLKEISSNGLRYWFAKYLPSDLLKVYPDYPLNDNPVKGIGVHMVYDNTNEMVYITKRDYKPLRSDLTYDADGNFYIGGTAKVSFTDTSYFQNASWTISYDPKTQTWISFHDWIPTFLLPGKAHFASVNNNTIWKHNLRCDSYCNFYGVDYPWEIEFVSTTGQTVSTMRSIEYLLEAYKYHHDCRDKFHVLNENFDQAMIYNSEQVSGLLNLNLRTKNDPLSILAYPKINYDSIDIQSSKVENKYRFNQFWDITKDRGQNSPNLNIPMFNTEANGYIYPINPDYVDYTKDALQHKKFRHNANRVWLRKSVSDGVKFLFKISNEKLLQSPR